MFSLVYQKENIYGVLDERTMKFHKLRKNSFDLMVLSAREENVTISGVRILDGDSYISEPVAYTKQDNIFNCLPYIEKKLIPSNLTPEKGYEMYFTRLISMTQSASPVDDVLSTIGLFAYYTLRVDASRYINTELVNSVVSFLANSDNTIKKALRTEPNESNVMRKFTIEPTVNRVTKMVKFIRVKN